MYTCAKKICSGHGINKHAEKYSTYKFRLEIRESKSKLINECNTNKAPGGTIMRQWQVIVTITMTPNMQHSQALCFLHTSDVTTALCHPDNTGLLEVYPLVFQHTLLAAGTY